MKTIVTGGSGLVGMAIRRQRPDWIYIDSKTYGSLAEIQNVKRMFDDTCPDMVVHLAANVGGLFKNMNKRREMYEDNIKINTNVLSEAANRGVKREIGRAHV